MMAEVGNKEPLVSIVEFRSHFANPSKYLATGEVWPRSTILLYKYSSNANYTSTDYPENTWKRLDNEPMIHGMHAEQIMIRELVTIQQNIDTCSVGSNKRIHSIEVIQSYSPCIDCSGELCVLKKGLDGRKNKSCNVGPTDFDKGEAIKFKITFSNFYRHFKLGNHNGLKQLLKSGIKLDIFTDDNWKYFFNATGLVTERQRREMDDKKILQYFEETVALETITDYLEAHHLGLPY